MALVDTTTGEIVTLTADEARELTNRIRQTVSIAWTMVAKAYSGRAWTALGYESWDAYCDAEFDTKIRLPREERREVVGSLREAGLSTRAIASATGVSHATVERDLSGGTNVPPAVDEPIEVATTTRESTSTTTKVTGLDGKSYSPPVPKPATPVADYRKHLQETDPDLILLQWRHNFAKAVHRVAELPLFTAESVAEKAEPADIDDLRDLLDSVAKWFERVESLRPRGLRVVSGGER